VNFFFDNCISFRIAHALNVLDEHNNIVALRDKFPANVRDIEWIIRTRQGKREMGHHLR